MTIRWAPYLRGVPPQVPPEELERLEEKWGVSLPEAYKETVALHQGMAPEPCVFSVGRVTDVLCTLLTVSTVPGKEPYSVETVHSILKPLVPTGLFPFANTPGGEFLCFDYRKAPSHPTIVLITVEGHILPVAKSFESFMGSLQPS